MGDGRKGNKMEKEIFVKCQCCCSALEISKDEEEDCFNVALWSYGPLGQQITSWHEKLRWCWNIIKTGMPWSDHTIVTKEDAARIVKFLNSKLNENGKNL